MNALAFQKLSATKLLHTNSSEVLYLHSSDIRYRLLLWKLFILDNHQYKQTMDEVKRRSILLSKCAVEAVDRKALP